MKRYLTLPFIAVLIVGVFSWVWIGGSMPKEYEAAAEHGIDFIVDEYTISKDDLTIDSVDYWDEEDRFALSLIDKKEDKTYEVALRLNEDDEISFILDVTGQFDVYGLAYCH
ncbi:hypothetical protein QA612_10910 [Evansella sp. AB-P1]|uniref:hypothetical protein n=1 Tax=Evansella sp. AB-P1 TaxID=3037653 RepID=UPI00241EFC4A|nr:hypothetical protein [Evansella sp. AB-P1]MDG5787999.1 hypothetical protein [Evansella sp. AB-P1]